MTVPALKLAVYLNETLRSGGRLAGERVLEAFEAAGVKTSVLLRGIEGFGAHHRLHTERFENAALNQPIVAVAVDERERIEALVPEIDAVLPSGLVTTERAHLATGPMRQTSLPETLAHDSVKLTIYCGRAERASGQPAFRAIVDHLQSSGVSGATVFLGVDGTVHGRRERATFFSRNRDVPVMIIAVGSREAVARCLPGLDDLAEAPIVTVEGVQLCKHDGQLLAAPMPIDDEGEPPWRKLMIYAAGDRHVGGESLHFGLVEALRRTGAAGATSVRGIWGYRGADAPHGDSVWSIRRRSPVVTIVIDRGEAMAGTWQLVDAMTREHGVVTSELVPAHRAVTPRAVAS